MPLTLILCNSLEVDSTFMEIQENDLLPGRSKSMCNNMYPLYVQLLFRSIQTDYKLNAAAPQQSSPVSDAGEEIQKETLLILSPTTA